MLGIVVALEREARLVRGAVAATATGARVRVAVSGMGGDAAAASARGLLAAGATGLAAVGLAGALDDTLRAGDLVLPETVAVHGAEVLHVHPPWRERLRARCATPAGGLLVSVAQPVSAAGARRRLARDTGAVAVDMESAAVAREALSAGVPFVALRAVSDAVTQSLPRCTVSSVDAYGTVRLPGLLAGLARRPWEVPALLRLAAGVRRAERALSQALVAALPLLGDACASGER